MADSAGDQARGLADNFLSYLARVRNYSPNTAAAYAQDLDCFLIWASNCGIDVL